MVKTTATAAAGPLSRFLALRKKDRPSDPSEARTLAKLAVPTAARAGGCGSVLSAPLRGSGSLVQSRFPSPLSFSRFFFFFFFPFLRNPL